MEGLEDGGTTWDETMVEFHQTQKLVQLTLGMGLGQVLDHSNLGGEGPCWSTWWPRNSREVTPKTHLETLSWMS